MGQPEMQPDGPFPEGGGKKRGDLLGRSFPLGDWGEPAERLNELYQWVEEHALRTVEWYLADRIRKRRAARLLRGGTLAGLAAGAALPLLQLAGAVDGNGTVWACMALLGAAVCRGCDRYFGLTSGWVRDVATAQAVQRRLEAMQYEWASESIREVLGPTEGTASEAAERCLGVLRRFSEDVTELVRTETTGWMAEFLAGTASLAAQQPVPRDPVRQDNGPATAGRSAMPPGARPNMPRQRPPEPPR